MLTALYLWILGQLPGILIGAALMFVVAIMYLNHNFKSRPQWCFDKIAYYAAKFQPGVDIVERYTVMLRASLERAKVLLKQKQDKA